MNSLDDYKKQFFNHAMKLSNHLHVPEAGFAPDSMGSKSSTRSSSLMESMSSMGSSGSKRPDNLRKLIHFNNAGLQPITLAANNKIQYWAQRFWEEGFNTDKDYMNDIQRTRDNLAKLIDCDSHEIAFFTSTAGAINQIAFSFGLKNDDEVLMWDQEYGSHLYPWKAACDAVGARLVLVESDPNLATSAERYFAAITPKTKVLAFSWIQFMSGSRMINIQEKIRQAQENGIFISVDIIQGLGLHPFSMREWGVDAVMGGSHKWLSSPVGVGYLALSERHFQKFKPHNIGMYTYGTCDDPSDFACEPKRDATKFEPGSKQVLEITALGASVEVILKAGVINLEKEALRLAKVLRQGLSNLGFRIISPFDREDLIHSTPFINFLPFVDLKSDKINFSGEKKSQDELDMSLLSLENKQKTLQISKKLNEKKIFHALRGPGIRFTPHAFNTDGEVEEVLAFMKEIKSEVKK